MCCTQFIRIYYSHQSCDTCNVCSHIERAKIETNVAYCVAVTNAITSIVCSADTVARFRRIRHSILICLLAPVSKRFRFRKRRMHLREFHLSMLCKRNIGSKREPEIHVAVKEIDFLRLKEIHFLLGDTFRVIYSALQISRNMNNGVM